MTLLMTINLNSICMKAHKVLSIILKLYVGVEVAAADYGWISL